MEKPIIGITNNTLRAIPEAKRMGIGADEQTWQLLAEDYLDSIENAGAIPIILPITLDLDSAKQLWNKLDGILISGGADVNPMIYGDRIGKECGFIDNKRDNYEIELVKYCVSNNKPLLGVCRGLQILNSVLGGTIHQDLIKDGYSHHSIDLCLRNEGVHEVEILKNTPLYNIFGENKICVNSFHHQGINKLANCLEKMAVGGDGLVESVYLPNKKFIMAVQWHPEMMFDDCKQKKLIDAFVKAC